MGSPEENKELVRYYFEQLEAGNVSVLEEVVADEFTTEYDLVRSDIDEVSKESLNDVLQEILTAFPDTSIESQALFAEGNTVIFIQTWCGTHLGEYRGVPPSGNEVTYEFWGRFVVEDEEIVHANVQGDNFGLFTQLGLELSVQGYQTLIETAPDPIVIADVDTGRVIETNSAAESILERPREAIVGADHRELHPPDQRYEDLLEDAVTEARSAPVRMETFADGSSIELLRSDGSRVPVEASAQVVTLTEQTTLVWIYRDVSERRRREQRRQVLNRILRHNLSNELNLVAGLADVLVDELDGETASHARQIRTTARDLAALGEKARVADRIKSVGESRVSQVSIRGVVDAVVAEMSEAYPNSEVETDLPDPVTVSTDRDAVEIALEEVIENALEHGTTPGGDDPQVRIRTRTVEQGDAVEIVVEDDGPGIPEHELEVLERERETALTHGSGIGIWLVHWAITAVRGDVDFEATGTGTQVTLAVPSLDSGA
jgi:PAS domain S-box-containing protein